MLLGNLGASLLGNKVVLATRPGKETIILVKAYLE